MELNNLDNAIKEKLELRRLQPSHESWNRLSERLDKSNGKLSANVKWLIGVAASVIGILFVAFQYFNTQEITPVIGDTPAIQNDTDRNLQLVTDQSNKSSEQLEESFELKAKSPQEPTKQVVVSANLNHQGNIFKKGPNVKTSKNDLITSDLNITDPIAHTKLINKGNAKVTDTDINILLKEAQKELDLDDKNKNNNHVVSPDLLLQTVETDLDQSFRSKVFETIKTSYNTLKTAVAQRNN